MSAQINPLASPDPAVTAWVPIFNSSAAVTAPSEYAFNMQNGPNSSCGVGTWATVKCAPGTLAYSTPSGAFTVNADGSVTVRDAGYYSLKASLQSDAFNGYMTAIFASTPNDWQGGLGGVLSTSMGATSTARFQLVGDLQLAAGAKVFVNVAPPATINVALSQFAISRIAVQGQQGATGPPGPGVVSSYDTAWHNVGAAGEVPFKNGWSNYDGTRVVRYRKLSSGLCVLAGIPKSGTVGAAMFTLPVGWRNAIGDLQFLCMASGGIGNVAVLSSGDVQVANVTAGTDVTSYIYAQACWYADS